MAIDADTLAAQRWAITGAAGRIGTTLRAGLLRHVAGLVLIDSRPVAALRHGESAVRVDLADATALRDAFQGVHGVIHLAAIPDEADFHDLVETNVIGSFHVFEAARQAGVRRVVAASSGRVIGMYDVTETVTPDMPVRPDGLYAVSKIAGEAIGRLYAEKFGMDVACLRIGTFENVPHDARTLSTWLSPADAVRAFQAAMTRDPLGFGILFAYSDNDDVWVDLAPGRALGFDPQDNAADYRDGIPGRPGPVTGGRQAGELATPEFTLSRQRSANEGSADPAADE